MRKASSLRVVVGVAVGAVSLAACTHTVKGTGTSGSPSDSLPPLPRLVLDHTAVESTIEKAGYTGVVCDGGNNPEIHAGATFTCTADGGKTIKVTMTDDTGHYAWSPA